MAEICQQVVDGDPIMGAIDAVAAGDFVGIASVGGQIADTGIVEFMGTEFCAL